MKTKMPRPCPGMRVKVHGPYDRLRFKMDRTYVVRETKKCQGECSYVPEACPGYAVSFWDIAPLGDLGKPDWCFRADWLKLLPEETYPRMETLIV
jgi:hypothetical protein